MTIYNIYIIHIIIKTQRIKLNDVFLNHSNENNFCLFFDLNNYTVQSGTPYKLYDQNVDFQLKI